jgi:hypothetical protein
MANGYKGFERTSYGGTYSITDSMKRRSYAESYKSNLESTPYINHSIAQYQKDAQAKDQSPSIAPYQKDAVLSDNSPFVVEKMQLD